MDKKKIEGFSPINRWRGFLAESNQDKFAGIFYPNGIPKNDGWFFVGEIALHCIWLLLVLAFLSICIFDLSALGDIKLKIVFLVVAGLSLHLFGILLLLLAVIIYPLVSLPIWLFSKVKNRTAYWILLYIWAVLCFILSAYFGANHQKTLFVANNEGVSIPTTYLDWINPNTNLLVLIFGYPTLLFILVAGLIFQLFYYKYRDTGDKNWPAEGLDAHLLDGDADN